MLLFVAAALAALLLAPDASGTSVTPGTATTASFLAPTSPRSRSEVLDPWGPTPLTAPAAASPVRDNSLGAVAAALAAGEVVDPWAPRPPAFVPGPPITAVVEPVDPWQPSASSSPSHPAGLQRSIAARRAHSGKQTGKNEDVRDPWSSRTDTSSAHTSPKHARKRRPRVVVSSTTPTDIADPWSHRSDSRRVRPVTKARPVPSPSTKSRGGDADIRDPWRRP